MIGLGQFLKRLDPRSAQHWLDKIDSANGFERQAAVQALTRLRHAHALPQLLARANDWVPQVRQAAHDAVRLFLDAECLFAWIGALDALVKLQEARRADHQALLEDIAQFLSRADTLAALRELAPSATIKARRYVFDLEWRHAQDDEARAALLQQAMQGDDVRLARWSITRLAGLNSAPLRQRLLQEACGSKFSAVRAAAVRQVLAQSVALPQTLMLQLCQDNNPNVRANALAVLRTQHAGQAAVTDALKMLHNEQASARQQAVALHFLSVAAPQRAAPLCQQALDARAAPVRRVAFAVLLAQAEGERVESLLLQALADPSAKVQTLAVAHIRRGAAVPDVDEVMRMARLQQSCRTRIRMASILDCCASWLRLQYLLELFHDFPGPEDREAMLQALARWERDARHNFVAPTAAQLDAMHQRWHLCARRVPEPLRVHIDFHLRTAKPLRDTGPDNA